jgi:DnaJ-class molecular chaperone
MVKKYYKILGLEVGASLKEAEERYNHLIEEFNPEKQEGDLKAFFKNEQDNVEEAYNKVLENIIELKEEDKKAVVISKLSDTSNQNQVTKKKNIFRLRTPVLVD